MNEYLQELKNQDQAVRHAVGDIDWEIVSKEDTERRMKVTEILKNGEVRSAEDFYNAALIFQHGPSVDDIQLAYSLARISSLLNPDDKDTSWLCAAAWDRHMEYRKRPQWYGTQFTEQDNSEEFELYEIDETAVSDAERIASGVPTLSESKADALTIRQKILDGIL
ncbi:MAG: hypothetical protein COA79_21900 [Planctomycetota bacterium]|nr:MAG: hypothetical protein COA79_21900 [Planctomycetota bacterium]